MDVFRFRDAVVEDYSDYVRSFVTIRDPRVEAYVANEIDSGVLWPEPLIQLNPAFEPAPSVDSLIADGVLHPACRTIFASRDPDTAVAVPFRLHRHQVDGILAAYAVILAALGATP